MFKFLSKYSLPILSGICALLYSSLVILYSHQGNITLFLTYLFCTACWSSFCLMQISTVKINDETKKILEETRKIWEKTAKLNAETKQLIEDKKKMVS